MKISGIIVAAGSGSRMGYGKNKVFMPLLGRQMLLYTLEAFCINEKISDIVLVTSEPEYCERLVAENSLLKVKKIVKGGDTRQESVYKGILECDGDYVCIHDGARALVSSDIIDKTIEAALIYGGAAPGVKCKDTLKQIDDKGFISGTVDREKTVNIQTPQVFLKSEIEKCHKNAIDDNLNVTDDCALFEHYGKAVKITEGSYENIKLTTPEDVLLAEKILYERCKK